MSFHFWYKKGSKNPAETTLDTSDMMSAYNMAHEIMRGFYAKSEEDTLGEKYYFYNSMFIIVWMML